MRRLWQTLRARWAYTTDGWSSVQRELTFIGSAMVILGALAAAGYFFAMPQWRAWQQRRVLDQVRLHAQNGDYAAMMLALPLVVKLAPNDPETWRAAAHYLAMTGSAEVIPVRQQLLRVAPHDTVARLALARDALALGQPTVADAALRELPDDERKQIEFHRLAAMLAAAMGRTDELETHLAAVIAAVPSDADARFNYAMSGLGSPVATTRERARTMLEALTAERRFRVRAAIALLTDTAGQRDARRMEELLTFLLGRFAPGAVADFNSPGVPGWEALITGFKERAVSREDVALLGRWLADSGRPREVIAWLEQLPATVARAPEVMDLRAELCASIDDLDRLKALLADNAWGEWPLPAQKLAIESRTLHLAGQESQARATWVHVEVAGNYSLATLRSMARLATAWRDVAGAERAWRSVLARHPNAMDAYVELRGIYEKQDDLAKLIALYEAWSRRVPGEATVEAQWIALSCLRKTVDAAMAARAEKLLEESQGYKPAVVALAAVRWEQRRFAEADALMRALSPNDLANPAIAFWRALISADLGRREEFLSAKSVAQRSILLKEQAKLLQDADFK
ncbi:hypothetical protein [Oleiharenicola lentus]|uniref:hypothetical protein n=1 Tax=Oleiharenicola lentus TaxID=2508720 RepID=UPI003F66FF43